MSKFRRSSSVCSSPRRDNNNQNANYNLNKSKLLSHEAFVNRVQKSLYYGRARVSIPLSDYIADVFSETHKSYSLNRLNHATIGQLRTTPCSLILAMIYLERLKDADPAYTKHITPTELFLVSMMVATKFYSGHDDDSPTVNWSEYANMAHENLLRMELAFLAALNWNVYVSNEDFFEKVQTIEKTLARRQGLNRGWFTYMELHSLLPSINVTKSFLHFTFILGLSYTAFVATIVASVFLVSQIPGSYLNASSRTASITDDNALTPSNTQRTDHPDIQTSSENRTNFTADHHLTSTENNDNVLLDITIDSLIDEVNSETKRHDSITEPINLANILQTETFDWSVIINSLSEKRKHDFCMDNDHKEFPKFKETNNRQTQLGIHNLSIYQLFMFPPNPTEIRTNFNGIKMNFV